MFMNIPLRAFFVSTTLIGCEGSGLVPDSVRRPPDVYQTFDAGVSRFDASFDARSFQRDVVADVEADVRTDVAQDSPSCTPDPCPSHILFNDGTEVTCLHFEEVSRSTGLEPSSSITGVSVADYNGDGRMDVYVLRDSSNLLFRNDSGRFLFAASAGLDLSGRSRGAVFGDADGDGDPDLVLLQETGSHLYQNQGGVFLRTPDGAGIHNTEPGRAGLWMGANFLLGTENGTRVYRPVGGGRYEEAARAVGLDDPGEASAIVASDYDGDGRQDIYVANTTGRNRLFHARADGTYESVEWDLGVTVGDRRSTDAAWVQDRGETRPSLYVANYERGNAHFVNRMGRFVDISGGLGIHDPGNTTRIAWGDFLGTSHPFLFLGRWDQPNILYMPDLSVGGVVSRHVDQAPALGMNVTARTVGAIVFDYDNDGRPDLLVGLTTGIRLYHNVSRRIRGCPREER